MNQARENTSFAEPRLPNPGFVTDLPITAQDTRELCYYPVPHDDISGVAV